MTLRNSMIIKYDLVFFFFNHLLKRFIIHPKQYFFFKKLLSFKPKIPRFYYS